MSLSTAWLHAALTARLPADASSLVVALSGGPDSAALLAALASMPHPRLPLRALHVDHGLQAAAAHFREHCVALCERWCVPLKILQAHLQTPPGASLEAAAREARYRLLAAQLHTGECLLTAHHAEDQAETLLLQALRGAGLKGLASMPVRQPLGLGHHVRLLLDVPHAALLALGAGLDARGAPDPMNEDLRFDRNYLRRALWPTLVQRWPGAAGALARTARLLAEAQDLVDQSARRDVTRLRDGAALQVPALRALSPPRRHAAVRLWLSELDIELPSEARLGEALRQVFAAQPDQLPAVLWGVHALRRYRQRLFVTTAYPPRLQGEYSLELVPGARLQLGPGLGSLVVVQQRGGLDGACCPLRLTVRARLGGESLKRHAKAATQSVPRLCQSIGVLPWQRDALPLLWAGEVLAGVADLWLESRFCVAANAPGLGIVWQDAPLVV